jgi:uncharacterized protein (TIGR03435 family)
MRRGKRLAQRWPALFALVALGCAPLAPQAFAQEFEVASVKIHKGGGGTSRELRPGSIPVSALATLLSNLPAVGRPVIDRTGLAGQYTFTLSLSDTPAASAADLKTSLGADADPLSSPIISNLQFQLGLKLDSVKAPMEVIVIDHVEKTPTED